MSARLVGRRVATSPTGAGGRQTRPTLKERRDERSAKDRLYTGNQSRSSQENSCSRIGRKLFVDDGYLSFSVTPSNNSRSLNVSEPTGRRRGVNACKFDRDKYLRISCQFVLINYVECAYSLDKLIRWELVEEVRLNCCEEINCPICLQPPVAAKITKCGHVYCYACILHCLSTATKRWCSCPICSEHVYKEQLKSVKLRSVQRYSIGHNIKMLLMRRSKKGVVALPAIDMRQPYDSTILDADDPCSRFGKVLRAQSGQLCAILKREKEELEYSMRASKDDCETLFIQQALEEVKQRELSDQLEGSAGCSNAPSGALDEEKSRSPTNAALRNVYFYQVDDGQYVFLHSLNVKCLCHQYGDLSNCPAEVTGEILETEEAVMDETMREKCKHLAHIPLGARLTFVELRLGQSVLSAETVGLFSSATKRRAEARRKKELEEKQSAEKALRWEESVLRGVQGRPLSESSVNVEERAFELENWVELPAGQADTLSVSGSPVERTISFAQVLHHSNSTAQSSRPSVVSDGDCAPAFKATFASAVDKIFENFQNQTSAENSADKKSRRAKCRVLFST